jgi:hypothetical protein
MIRHPVHGHAFVDHGHAHVYYDDRGQPVGELPVSSSSQSARRPYHGGRAKKSRNITNG